MQKTKKILKPVIVVDEFVCDACGRTIHPGRSEDDDIEYQEMLHVRMESGHGSIFGAGIKVEGDFCQTCVDRLLGKFLRYSK